MTTDPSPNKANAKTRQVAEAAEIPEHGSPKQDHRHSMDINQAYKIAGVVVSTYHARFHRLEGQLSLKAGLGPESVIQVDPTSIEKHDDVQTPDPLQDPVAQEHDMLILAGRQAELVHLTLNAPAELDFAHVKLDLSSEVGLLAQPAARRQRITEALATVTRHWHEIECLAAWLVHQTKDSLRATELERQIADIKEDDHGLFP